MSEPKYAVGQMVMTRSTHHPKYDSDCAMVTAVKSGRLSSACVGGYIERVEDIEYEGWVYQTDTQEYECGRWYAETCLHPIPRPGVDIVKAGLIASKES